MTCTRHADGDAGDLTRRFEELLGTVWPAGHPQIYGELRRLQDAAEAGIRLHEALADWATWAENHQPGTPET